MCSGGCGEIITDKDEGSLLPNAECFIGNSRACWCYNFPSGSLQHISIQRIEDSSPINAPNLPTSYPKTASVEFAFRVYPPKNDQVLFITFSRDKLRWSTLVYPRRFTEHQLFLVKLVDPSIEEIDFASSGQLRQPLWAPRRIDFPSRTTDEFSVASKRPTAFC